MADESAGISGAMSNSVNSPAVEQMVEQVTTTTETAADNVCCICMEQIDVASRAVLNPCGHRYHKECIDEWFRTSRNRTCSYCRTPSIETQFAFQADGTFRTDPARRNNGTPRALGRQRRFLMCIITRRVYLYTLAGQLSFTIVNSTLRTIELVDEDSQVVATVNPGDHQINVTLNNFVRFQDEPQIEFTLFNLDNFFHGSVLVPVHSTAVQTGQLLRQELINIEDARIERQAAGLVDQDMEEDPETPRMRRRR